MTLQEAVRAVASAYGLSPVERCHLIGFLAAEEAGVMILVSPPTYRKYQEIIDNLGLVLDWR